MDKDNRTINLKVSNMTCVNCENKIETVLQNKKGIISVKANYADSNATVTYDQKKIKAHEIEDILEMLDYKVKTKETKKTEKIIDLIIIAIVIFVIYRLMKMFGSFSMLNSFPQIQAGMSLGMIFIIGLLTSTHCIAMCGGINISQCIPDLKPKSPKARKLSSLRPGILYNTGRVISYTIIGGFVGGLGSVINLSSSTKGYIAIAAAIFMVIMGLNTLNIFPALRKINPRLPVFFAKRINDQKSRTSNRPFYVGLLNGLMPCGPLQAMQLYALSTGSAWMGAVSMLIFSLGTVPFMFGLGALSSVLSKMFMSRMAYASGVLVIILGLFMFNNGTSLIGIQLNPKAAILNSIGLTTQVKVTKSVIENKRQTITTTLASGDYTPIEVKANLPVKWTIQATSDTLNGCNESISIPAYGIEKDLTSGDNIIEFTPKDTGTILYTCWMGMISSTITIVK